MGRVSPAPIGSAIAESKSGVNDAISSVSHDWCASLCTIIVRTQARMWPPEWKNLTKLL